MTPRASIIIPTYNESANLPALLERIARALSASPHAYEIVVADDDSPDRTWELAESLRGAYPQLRVIRRAGKEKGLSPAVLDGWSEARGEILGVMDADLQHPPELLPQLLAVFDDPGVDVVVASRYMPDAAKLKWNPVRKWISRGASNLAQAVLPPQAQVTDPMSGYFFLRRRVLEGAPMQAKGYKILLALLCHGRYDRVAEVPYVFGRRHGGQSKLGAMVMRDYLSQLWKLAWSPTGTGRFLRFCLVGSTGVVVNMGVMWWLKGGAFLGTLRAGAVAIECAIVNNYLWNELWTFRDRSGRSPALRQRLWRFARFNLICAAGAAIHLLILKGLAIQLGWHYLGVNLLAIVLVTLWNYGLNTTWTWTELAPGGTGRRTKG
jgi:dolichol-phosphate mannosyltransferase